MQKRLIPITVLTGILFITALVGYLIPETPDEPPVRVLLENKGGKVIFTHMAHAELQDQDCAVCHHTSGTSENPPACTSCHVAKFDETFAKTHQEAMDETQCSACHHARADVGNFSHENHVDDYVPDDCTACHHDESIEPEPQACADCHEQKGDGSMPSLMDAAHERCADCHEDMYDEGAGGCRSCHTREKAEADPAEYRPCADCHTEPVDQLIPTTTNAFHGQCMTCHEKQGAGPFGDDACGQCHMK